MEMNLTALGSNFLIKNASQSSWRLMTSAAKNFGHEIPNCDVAIVGGGIVGLATAQELVHRYPELSITVLEKEPELSRHQSGHNSGVIHAGIYYKPGSLMAKLCVEGLHSTYSYCDKHNLPYKKCGKLVVATNQLEVKRLLDLFERAKQNNVPEIILVEGQDICKYQPKCQGLRAIYSPHTGIVDWEKVALQYGKVFQERGGKIKCSFKVEGFQLSPDPDYPVTITTSTNEMLHCKYVLTCGGLYSDRLARLSGCQTDPQIVPFRGEYLLLSPEKAKDIKTNIYPVPDPSLPFLGVHFTPRMNGEVWLGPNAVLACHREGYKWSDINIRDLHEVLKYPGFYRLVSKYFTYGLGEVVKSWALFLTAKELQKFVPSVTKDDISRGSSGVRAQAMTQEGNLVGDFVFDSPPPDSQLHGRILHCRNAPSPGATSSLAIARMMSDKVAQNFHLPKRDQAVLY